MDEHEFPSQPVFSAPQPGAGEPRAGDVVGERYLVLGPLGRGSLGLVLEAENLQTGKRVALKWLEAARVGEAARERFVRFQREGRTIAQICHPNVVDIQDLGEHEGTPFLVTERLYGETLRARLTRGPLSWDEARRVLAGVLRGLSAAHRAGVIHRELKPENVFLCLAEHGQPPTPKLLDFAVACLRPAPDAPHSLADPGPPPAAPAYLALEQLTGDPLDARCDVYAAGVVLYEALTAKLPFQARGAAELAVLQATSAPARPSLHVPTLRGAPERLLLRALHAAPPARYQDAATFAAALDNRPRAAGAGLAKTLGAAALLACAAYAVYAELGVRWDDAARASSDPAPSAASAPLPTAETSGSRAEGRASLSGSRAEGRASLSGSRAEGRASTPPPAAAPSPGPIPASSAPVAPPKPSKRWMAHHLAVTRGAEATRALQAELAAQGRLATQAAESGEPSEPEMPPNPYAAPAAQPRKGL